MWWLLGVPFAEQLLGPFAHPQGGQDPPACAGAVQMLSRALMK